MKVSKLLLCIVTASLICETISLNINNSDSFFQIGTSKLPKFICNVIESAKHEDQGLNTVAIVITENQLELSIIDDMMRCMPMEISTTMIDLRLNDGRMDVKAQMVIMFADQIDETNQMMTAILTANHMSKFLIVTSDPEKFNVQNFQQLFTSNGIQNFAIISQDAGSIVVQRPETFNGEVKVVREIQKSKRFYRQMFPDKLKNLHGYKYQIAVDFSSYGTKSRHNRIVQRTSHLFRSIVKAQNASLKLTRVKESSQFDQQNFDFIINAHFAYQRQPTSTVLYSNNNICILMPKVNKFTTREIVAPQKTDISVICSLGLTYIFLFVIWRLYKDQGAVESPVMIIFKTFAAYTGQSIQFSRDNRLVLRILIQILMVMAIFANIINQWNIGTTLAYPQGELSLQDTYKIFSKRHDTIIAVDAILDEVMTKIVKSYYLIKSVDRIVLFDERSFVLSSYDLERTAVIGQCEFVKIMATQNQHFFVYYLPSILSSTQIYFGPQNPFIEKIEDYVKYGFEAGLTDIWETMLKMRIFGKNFQKSEATIEMDVFNILGFDKLLPLFYTLFRGFGIAFVVLVLEIFYYGFIKNLSWQMVIRWTSLLALRKSAESNKNINWQNIGRVRRAWYFWKQQRKLKVQRVNVEEASA